VDQSASPESRDEVSYSDYQKACSGLARDAAGLAEADPDEAAEHYLPQITQHIAIIFSFVGSNMTARHVPKFVRSQAALDRAKDRAPEPGFVLRAPGSGSTVDDG
jgi:hypothetical protein